MGIKVVTGPAAVGKSTYVINNRKPGDVIIDFDVIAVAFGSPSLHDHPFVQNRIAQRVRETAIEVAFTLSRMVDNVWIIDADPSQARINQYEVMGAEFIPLSVPEEVRQQRLLNRRVGVTPRPVRDSPQA